MRFEEKKNCVMWQDTAAGLLTDVVVSIAIVGVAAILIDYGISIPVVDELKFSEQKWILVAFVGVQIAKLLSWARGLLKQIFAFRLYLREVITDRILDAITKAELPEPPDGYMASSQHYFDSIVVDDTVDCQKRIEAAYWLASLQYPENTGRLWEASVLENNMVAALDRYSTRCYKKRQESLD